MNSIIKQQLNSCKGIVIPAFDDSTTHITIPKQTGYVYVMLKENKEYIIEFENYILNPPQDSSLHANWNNNIPPKDRIMKVFIKQVMGSMINLTGYGYDLSIETTNTNIWSGWIPLKAIKVIKEL